MDNLKDPWETGSGTQQPMNTEPPPIPPSQRKGLSIQYTLTRGDIFGTWMTILLRNRIIQVLLLVTVVFNGWITLSPKLHERTLVETLGHGLSFLLTFVITIVIMQCILGAASAFLLKHRGVLGQHVLEITEEGLIE